MKKIYLFVICVLVGYIFFILREPQAEHNISVPFNPAQFSFTLETVKRVELQRVIVEGVAPLKRLNVMEADLKQEILLENKIWNMDFLKQSKKLVFLGKGIYSVDLSNNFNILFDNTDRIITVNCNKPSLDSVSVDETKITFEDTKNAVLRFGDLKATPEELGTVMKLVNDSMTDRMLSEEMYNNGMANGEKSIRQLIIKFIPDEYKNYRIEILWNE